MSHKSLVVILLAFGLTTHFLFFGHPNQTVFDEVHFGKFVSGYYTHEYYFDIHPPLGKIMIAGFGKLFNFQPEFSFAEIGDEFPDSKYMALRFLPSLMGSLLPAVIFFLALQLGFSRRAAFATGLLVALENGILVQTRFMLMDGFLILFGFLSLLFYLKSRSKILNTKYLILASIFAGLAASIKWTGLSFLGIILVMEVIKIWKTKKIGLAAPSAVKFIIIPIAVYFAVFALHFALLTKPGTGDAFMSQEFHNKNTLDKFVELNIEMYRSNQRLMASHPYSSQWYTWPLMTRPIFYWTKDAARIYLLGNPLIWWGSTIAVLYALLSSLKLKVKSEKIDKTLALLLGGFAFNFLPFIGIKRVMFLYHYLAALIFAILILAYIIEKEKNSKKIFGALLVGGIIAFIYFAPLSYGLPLSKKAYESHVWLPSWK